jgi:hypothetical protein
MKALAKWQLRHKQSVPTLKVRILDSFILGNKN